MPLSSPSRLFAASVKSAEVVAAPAPPPVRTALPRALVVAAVVLGVALRGYGYARNPSLWLDEAMLALNVVHKSPSQLLEPLDLNQGAPVGYLLASKAVVNALGGGEYALRLISLVASLAGLAVFVPFATAALPLPAARIAIGLFALSPYLAGYAAEFKQYELDAALAVAALACGRRVWAGAGGLLPLTAVGVVGVWFSHPLVFVLGGVGAAVLLDPVARGDTPALRRRLVVVAAWAVSFGVCYALFTRKLGMNQYLLDYWAGKFLPLPPYKPGHFAWLLHHLCDLFDKPGGFRAEAVNASGLAALLAAVGGLVLAWTDWRLLVATALPLGLCLLASGLHKYPFAGRLMLFAVPALLVLVSVGTWAAVQAMGRAAPGGGLLVLGAVFAGPVMECHWLTKMPLHAEDAREVIAHAHAHYQPGDSVYVFYGAAAAFHYYQPRYPFPPAAVTQGVENRDKDIGQLEAELDTLRGRRRVWVIVAHRQSTEEAAVRAYLDGMGRRQDTYRRSDAVVWRYDLSGR
jgi:hypothetical protein